MSPRISAFFSLLFIGLASSAQPLDSLYSVSGSINGHEYVDMGLSVYWATVNIGASDVFAEGDYFA